MSKDGTGWWLDTIGRMPLLSPAQEIELGTRVQAWLQHPDGPDDCPRGIRRSGQRAKDQFVAANMRLAVSYVWKHCNRIISQQPGSFDDLIQSANLGVMRAVEKYDPTRGYRFSTYAYWWIRQSVNRWIDLSSRTISIPGSHSQLLARISIARRKLFAELLREPTSQELADCVDITLEQFNQLCWRARSPLSIDSPLPANQQSKNDWRENDIIALLGTNDHDLEQVDEAADNLDRCWSLLEVLQPQQQRIVMAMSGVCSEEMTLGQIAKQERISPKRVKLIYEASLQQMKGFQEGTWKPPIRRIHRPITKHKRTHYGPQLNLFDAA